MDGWFYQTLPLFSLLKALVVLLEVFTSMSSGEPVIIRLSRFTCIVFSIGRLYIFFILCVLYLFINFLPFLITMPL